MPNAIYELPYDGAKEMLLVDNVDNKDFLTRLFVAMYDELPAQKRRSHKIVKERIEGGANEKAVLRLFINCPFVCINFDFFWLNKACQLYMDF